ncbi:MAG: hypothetical protein ACXWTX_01845 [Gallionella sp.]
MYDYFAIKLACGNHPCDGFSGGPVVFDAGTLYVVPGITIDEPDICMSTALSSLVDDVLELAIQQDGLLNEAYGDSLLKLKAVFDTESAKLERALRTHPKFFIQKL